MIIENVMKKDVVTLTENDTIEKALQTVKDKKIRHIPIVDYEYNLIGLVTDVDLKQATPSIFRANEFMEDFQKPLKDIMRQEIITAHPLDFMEEIAAVFYEHNISCVPVLRGQKLVGIITETDLLHTYVELTGAHLPGSQIEIKVPNRPGVLSDITEIIKVNNVNVQSILVYPNQDDLQTKILVFRVQTMNPMKIIENLKEKQYEVLWPNFPGGHL